jgi:NADH/NAD ratio-sensing transcriptional regulator Rex
MPKIATTTYNIPNSLIYRVPSYFDFFEKLLDSNVVNEVREMHLHL